MNIAAHAARRTTFCFLKVAGRSAQSRPPWIGRYRPKQLAIRSIAILLNSALRLTKRAAPGQRAKASGAIADRAQLKVDAVVSATKWSAWLAVSLSTLFDGVRNGRKVISPDFAEGCAGHPHRGGRAQTSAKAVGALAGTPFAK
jgi:hypothetical protein